MDIGIRKRYTQTIIRQSFFTSALMLRNKRFKKLVTNAKQKIARVQNNTGKIFVYQNRFFLMSTEIRDIF